jgi:hypothetical protein
MIHGCRSSPAPTPASDNQRVPPFAATSRGPFAIVPGPNREWDEGCLARRECPNPAKALPHCTEDPQAESWFEMAAHAEKKLGQKVVVRGKLVLQSWMSTAMECRSPNACCNGASSTVVFDSAVATLQLGGLGCKGDDSQLCCDVLARGQWARASGRLGPDPDSMPGMVRWRLEDPDICVFAEASSHEP